MNKMALIGLTALSVYAWGKDELAVANKPSTNPHKKMKHHPQQQEVQEPSVVTLTSSRIHSDNHWYLFADVLYWHADVDNADWVDKKKDTSDPGSPHKNYTLNFKWDWGWRLGIGKNLDYDQWDTNLYYTWFQTSNSQSAGTSIAHQTLTPETAVFSGVGSAFSQGKIDWRIHYNMFDWELGRWFYVSRHLSLRPHLGLKGGWIDQKNRQSFSLVSAAIGSVGDHVHGSIKNKNDFWGIGAAGGLNTNWFIGHIARERFSIFGDFAGAIMYGHFHVEHNVSSADVTTGVVKASAGKWDELNRNLAVPMLQTILGLQWDMPFNSHRNHVTLRAGYEFQIWFRQNQMFNDFDLARFNGTFGLQGITVDLRFDF